MKFIDLKKFVNQIDLLNTLGGGIAQTSVNVEQSENNLIITVKMPSIKEDSYNVVVNNNKLVIYSVADHQQISGENDEGYSLPLFNEIFDIPYFVDAQNINAEVLEGELKVYMPFKDKEKVQPRRINIRNQ